MSRIRNRQLRHKDTPELEITAFMNLMVILVPFLLITAVFSHLTVLQLNLPSSGAASKNKKPDFELQVIIRKNFITLADSRGGLIKRIKNNKKGYNYAYLAKTLRQIKSRFPNKTNASILSAPNISYETLVSVMDSVRSYQALEEGEIINAELFPDISIGDAP